jgi:hypothetical protein
MGVNPKIAFDEAGNTGQNLLDPGQPVFVLASVHLSKQDALKLCSRAGTAGEVHFKKLKKSPEGRRIVLEILQTPLLSGPTVKVMVYHKPFMVTTKIVDILIEELARRNGIDLYERGGNLAMANLIHFATPVFCGRQNFERLQQAFVRMIRWKNREDIEAFYDSVARLYRHCSDKDYKSILATIAATRHIVGRVLANVEITDLDPAVPSFLVLCEAWDRELARPFQILHDCSKAIAFDKSLLERFMEPAVTDQEVLGAGRRTVKLPLRATGITFVDSASTPPGADCRPYLQLMCLLDEYPRDRNGPGSIRRLLRRNWNQRLGDWHRVACTRSRPKEVGD